MQDRCVVQINAVEATWMKIGYLKSELNLQLTKSTVLLLMEASDKEYG